LTVVEAVGNGGQLILMNKDLNVVPVVTAGNYNVRNLKKDSYHIFRDFIYPAGMYRKEKTKTYHD
jgi:hypothetical protein